MNFRRIGSTFVVSLMLGGLVVGAAKAGILLLPGDYNLDGKVSHADYSVLGDTFGSLSDLRADGNFDGVINDLDFDVYVAHYGETASLPSYLPFTVVPNPLPSGDLEWTFTFAHVNGSLAGHLNIDSDATILSMTGGPGFLDDGMGNVGVPGVNSSNAIEEGISHTSNHGFVALGTTLSSPPTLLNSDSTLEFLRLVTKGPASGPTPTTLTFSGEFGYFGADFVFEGSASFVPEPASWLIACIALLLIATGRRVA